MKLTLKAKFLLLAAGLGALAGAFWGLSKKPQPAELAVSGGVGLQTRKARAAPADSDDLSLGRLDPFQSPPSAPKEEETAPAPALQPAEPRAYYRPHQKSPEKPETSPALPWKLVGLGAGRERLALVKKGSETLVLKAGDSVEGWRLEEIGQKTVRFVRGKDKVDIALEEVSVGETDD